NYMIYHQELQSIVKHLKQGPSECEGSIYLIKILTADKHQEYFITSKLLNCRQT
ncbi:hypothetical protein K440DRAFT_546959, partial [Wilcoxina mikolae CBS 423.85]